MQTPLAFFVRGKSCLLSGEPYESLGAYAKALQISLNEQEIEIALNAINEIANFNQVSGYEWVRRFLLIGLATKFSTSDAGKAAFEQVKHLVSKSYQPFKEPVVVVAGGCSADVEGQMQTYKGFILKIFRDFRGCIISGGTISGVSGLIGEVQQKYPSAVRTVGYVPKTKAASVDNRYLEIRFTEGEKYSPVELLQYWIDIIASGVEPANVKLLGVNGGRISAIEYRVALALGSNVAVVKDSGMEAEKLFSDSNWNTLKNLTLLPNDYGAAWTFIQTKKK